MLRDTYRNVIADEVHDRECDCELTKPGGELERGHVVYPLGTHGTFTLANGAVLDGWGQVVD